MTSFETITLESIRVHWLPSLDGGGHMFGQDYLQFLKSLSITPVERAFEWCSGPGFIGFALLGHGLCHSLCLADINPLAVEACRETIRYNSLDDRVSVYLSDCLDSVPVNESWNLVVGNPPHANSEQWDIGPDWGTPLLWRDLGWRIHHKFYTQVSRHLQPGANVIIQENNELSSVDSFRDMIFEAGLELDAWTYHSSLYPRMYYLRSWKPLSLKAYTK